MSIDFITDSEREIHPQGKKINAFLMKRYFRNHLSDAEEAILANQLDSSDLIQMLTESSFSRQLRLLICCFSNGTNLFLMFSRNTHAAISPKTLALAALLTGHVAFVEGLRLSYSEIKALFSNKSILDSWISEYPLSIILDLLDFKILGRHKTLDCIHDHIRYEPKEVIYGHACKFGRSDILEHLESDEGFDKLNAAYFGLYAAYNNASSNGQIAILRHLEKIEGFDRNMVMTRNAFEPYRLACRGGQLPTVEYFESQEGFNALEAATCLDCEAYCFACLHGHMDIILHIEKIPGFLEKAFSSDNRLFSSVAIYKAYTMAAQNNQDTVMLHLESLKGFNRKVASEMGSFSPYKYACRNGNLEMVKHIEEIEGFNVTVANQVSSFRPYQNACFSGNLELMLHIEGTEKFDRLDAALHAYPVACNGGKLSAIKHLETTPGFDKLKVVMNHDFRAYFYACDSGDARVMEHLISIQGLDSPEAINANLYQRLVREAKEDNQYSIVAFLERTYPLGVTYHTNRSMCA